MNSLITQFNMFRSRLNFSLLLILCVTTCTLSAGDWPMWRYDAGRGAFTPDALPEGMTLRWTRQLEPSQPAWPPSQEKLQFDLVPEPVAAGQLIFVPSNVTDTVTAYDTRTGDEVWRFCADAPVRFAPVVDSGKVFFASDDGHLYALDATTGKLLWSFNGGPADRRILGNNRLVSSWPARGGPVLHDGRLYFSASIWPFMGIFIHCLEPGSGGIIWTNSGDGTNFIVHPHNAPSFGTVVPQGHFAAAGDSLVVPGGRSTPAVYDAHTGELRHFAFDKRVGSHAISVRGDTYFVAKNSYDRETGEYVAKGEPVVSDENSLLYVSGDRLLSLSAQGRIVTTTTKDRRGAEVKAKSWKPEEQYSSPIEDTPGDVYLRAGDRLYSAGERKVSAYELPAGGKAVWTGEFEGTAVTMLAADDKLFVVDDACRLYCFGTGTGEPIRHTLEPSKPAIDERWSNRVKQLAPANRVEQGHALSLGIGSGALIEALLEQTDFFVIAVDPDPARVDAFRRKMTAAGLYGRRVSAHRGDPYAFPYPKYVAGLIFSETPDVAELSKDPDTIRHLFETLRPYGGAMAFEMNSETHTALTSLLAEINLPNAEIERLDGLTKIVRSGALPGSDDWTHQYGDSSQSVVSQDRLVKAPLGLLWYGGPSNDAVLPRHGHGPSPQVAGGRLFIEGPDMLRCVDVYTGRVWWEKSLPGLGEFYDNTSHQPGAGEIGSNYVSLEDYLYVVYGDAILELDATSGQETRRFQLQPENGQPAPNWGYLGVSGDYLVATSDPLDVSFWKSVANPKQNELPPTSQSAIKQPEPSVAEKSKSEKTKPSPLTKAVTSAFEKLSTSKYAAGSRRLVVFNRITGERLWHRDAVFNFRHNNIVVTRARVFCIDRLTDNRLSALKRRGLTPEGTPVLYSLDLATGNTVWKTEQDVFGTFLNYSETHDTLIQAGSSYRDRAKDEINVGMIAYRGTDGELLWAKQDFKHGGPCLLWKDLILTNGGGGVALEIQTGNETGWKYSRHYGCNTAIGSEHLLTFRSGAAGFYDLLNDSGTGNLGGFKSSCTSNLIPANGVLNAPDYTRTCSCAYQNQTSLALIHMPEAEFWTFGGTLKQGRTGINLGAPGDRRDENGTLWLDVPSSGGESARINVKFEPERPGIFRHHASTVQEGDLPWVAASGIEVIERITIDVEQDKSYEVRLIFLEPENLKDGERLFDVLVQGELVLDDLDIRQSAGGSDRSLSRTFHTDSVAGKITLEFRSSTERGAILSGIELVDQGGK